MSILQIKDLIHQYITYGEKEEETQTINAVNGVDMSVEKGEFIAILGHNGSGKSSLAKHINGLLQPTSGSVCLKGMDTRDHEKDVYKRQRLFKQDLKIYYFYRCSWTNNCSSHSVFL